MVQVGSRQILSFGSHVEIVIDMMYCVIYACKELKVKDLWKIATIALLTISTLILDTCDFGAQRCSLYILSD